jgi:8-oxo-dGTP pyrophosphatase MutT (NUDIX family)
MEHVIDKNTPDFKNHEADDYKKVFLAEEARKKSHDAASALVVSNNHRNELMILLLNHPKIGKWIPIGGHVERYESVESAVIRELEEEIGISPIYWFDRNSKIWNSSPVIFDEKMEKIQAFKSNDIHFHRDFIFVAAVDYGHEKFYR